MNLLDVTHKLNKNICPLDNLSFVKDKPKFDFTSKTVIIDGIEFHIEKIERKRTYYDKDEIKVTLRGFINEHS